MRCRAVGNHHGRMATNRIENRLPYEGLGPATTERSNALTLPSQKMDERHTYPPRPGRTSWWPASSYAAPTCCFWRRHSGAERHQRVRLPIERDHDNRGGRFQGIWGSEKQAEVLSASVRAGV